jgi:transposase
MAKIGRPRQVEMKPHRRDSEALARLDRIAERARRKNDLRLWAKATAMTRWIGEYAKRGIPSLQRRESPGRGTKLDAQQAEDLKRAIAAGPRDAGFESAIWTARMVREHIQRTFGVEFNWKYVPRLLHGLGFSIQRPRKLLSRADHDAQADWLKRRLPAIKKKPVDLVDS